MKRIKNALVSVFHKDGLDVLVKEMEKQGVNIYSTGGTYSYIAGLGIEVNQVEDLTGYPSILGGRVKTLHPKVFGGILARREEANDQKELNEYEIPEFDMVVVDLYPFEKTVAETSDESTIIEKIDIGGISLIRAAAKNYRDVLIVPDVDSYASAIEILSANEGKTELAQRKAFAAKAFAVSSHYDAAIFNYFNSGDELEMMRVSENKSISLRYGENPHQGAKYYGDLDALFTQVHGKALSYNNLLDLDAAINLMYDFKDEGPCIAILKHNNACGLAVRADLKSAWIDALAGDPVSAFGGVIISNRAIDKSTAEEMSQIFFEVVIAPSYDDDALEVLKTKKNRVILNQKSFDIPGSGLRRALNGYLYQDADRKVETEADLTLATEKAVEKNELEDLLFANRIAKHTKSNTIVLAKNKQLIGSGTGQTSRVDALKQAITKAKAFNFDMEGAVMASDAFFPFPDCVEIAHESGISAVIQPGGSIRDNESVEYCNQNAMSMVLTGNRHFKH